MADSQHTIAGTVLTMPVRIRRADAHFAIFSVPAGAAAALIAPSGLHVCQYRPGRAAVMLMLARYLDGDLGHYHEFGTAVLVNPPGARARGPVALSRAAAFVQHMPVDQEFTLQAGRSIWGFPKIMANFTIRDGNQQFGFDVSVAGSLIAALEIRRGLPMPAALASRWWPLKAYTHTGGTTREVPWRMRISGVLLRPGGATLRLGEHPDAQELAALGLPRRATLSGSARNVEMSFGDARVVG
jgi:hypothetical protein